jgi:hypothetical protein
MIRILLPLLIAMAVLAADDDPWTKVRELPKGTELRVYKLNLKSPLAAQFDRAGEESLIVITADGQESIPKDEIDRVERRSGPPKRLETRVDRKTVPKGAEVTTNTLPGTTTSVKTGLSFPSKRGYEKVYERAAK